MALTEAGFTLHNCAQHHPRYRIGDVCLLPVSGSDDPGGAEGVVWSMSEVHVGRLVVN